MGQQTTNLFTKIKKTLGAIKKFQVSREIANYEFRMPLIL